MMSGALAGIISTASGLDIYYPALAFIIAFSAGVILKPCADWLERRGIDDAVGAVTVHGTIGLYGVVMLGIWGSGFPALQGGYVVSFILKMFGMLRVREGAELAGMDVVKVPAAGYPEWGNDASSTPAE